MEDLNRIEVGDIVREVNYIAYFNAPRKAQVGIVIKIYDSKSDPWRSYSQTLAKIYWFKSKKYEVIPIYLLTHYDQKLSGYQCEKI
tara:strand:- start:873 stop:1130 length:258 start_codon:yes stop_codon:yes gene_type:complete